MMWTTTELVYSIFTAMRGGLGKGDLAFATLDVARRVGVGVRSDSEIVLMLPSQVGHEGFKTKYAEFQPTVSLLSDSENNEMLQTSLLTCTIDSGELSQLQAVASIFSGLISLEQDTSDLGSAIWALKSIFETGFKSCASPDLIKGLLGELSIIEHYGFRPEVILAWHSNPGDKYDFSTGNTRIEVKATSSAIRKHKFSEGQVPGPANVEVYVASVKLQLVETGGFSLSEYILEIQKILPGDLFKKILETSTEYLGESPLSISSPRIDRVGTQANIGYYHGSLVPYPATADGVSEMSWKANLEGLDPVSRPDFT